MLYNVFSIRDTAGTVVGWATVSVNINERREADRALSESRQELRALSGRLIMAHEEESTCRPRDTVAIVECRPISKRKSWKVVEVLERAPVEEAAEA